MVEVAPGTPARVLICDDYPLFARGLAETLRERGDLWVTVAPEAPRALPEPGPVDILVAGIDGDITAIWQACDHLLGILPAAPPVVLLLPGRSEFEMTAAATLGAAAVLPRSVAPSGLGEALTAVVEGRTLVASGMAERMLSDFVGLLRRRREASGIDLSARELQVLELIADGRSNRDIAALLHISDHTVKNHVRRILEKLGAESRTEALVMAVRAGLVVVGQGSWSPNA
ncbi:MAG: response regulator transcription factor [Actinobacteria bacterium]|nr:response regulator transcription factor [Actinomycetota bacterium]